jgi:hypothetical protein
MHMQSRFFWMYPPIRVAASRRFSCSIAWSVAMAAATTSGLAP